MTFWIRGKEEVVKESMVNVSSMWFTSIAIETDAETSTKSNIVLVYGKCLFDAVK